MLLKSIFLECYHLCPGGSVFQQARVLLKLIADLYQKPIACQEIDDPEKAFQGAADVAHVAVAHAGRAVGRDAALRLGRQPDVWGLPAPCHVPGMLWALS